MYVQYDQAGSIPDYALLDYSIKTVYNIYTIML